MRLKNGEVCFRWPLAQHIITAGWLYNDGSLHRHWISAQQWARRYTPQRVAQ